MQDIVTLQEALIPLQEPIQDTLIVEVGTTVFMAMTQGAQTQQDLLILLQGIIQDIAIQQVNLTVFMAMIQAV
ncbi:hypothetical protein D9M72_556480 [compost metagenome]